MTLPSLSQFRIAYSPSSTFISLTASIVMFYCTLCQWLTLLPQFRFLKKRNGSWCPHAIFSALTCPILTKFILLKQVSDFYKRPTLESPSKLALEENAFLFENHGAQLLGQIKRGCCRARAILFKVLADTVGLESRLVVVSLSFSYFNFFLYLHLWSRWLDLMLFVSYKSTWFPFWFTCAGFA